MVSLTRTQRKDEHIEDLAAQNKQLRAAAESLQLDVGALRDRCADLARRCGVFESRVVAVIEEAVRGVGCVCVCVQAVVRVRVA